MPCHQPVVVAQSGQRWLVTGRSWTGFSAKKGACRAGYWRVRTCGVAWLDRLPLEGLEVYTARLCVAAAAVAGDAVLAGLLVGIPAADAAVAAADGMLAGSVPGWPGH